MRGCANGSNIVALRFGDHGTKEMLGVVDTKFDRFQTLRNNSKQNATTYNRVGKRRQHVTCNNVASVCTGFYCTNALLSWNWNRLVWCNSAYLAFRTKPHARRHGRERRVQTAHVINQITSVTEEQLSTFPAYLTYFIMIIILWNSNKSIVTSLHCLPFLWVRL